VPSRLCRFRVPVEHPPGRQGGSGDPLAGELKEGPRYVVWTQTPSECDA
jgi:hypothetical protein